MAAGNETSWLEDFCESSQYDQDVLEELSLTGAQPCFENTALRGAVHASFIVLGIARLIQLRGALRLPLGVRSEASWAYYLKLLAVGINVVVPILFLNGLAASGSNGVAAYELVTEPIAAVAWLVCLLVVVKENSSFLSRGRWILPFLWLFHAVADGVRVRTQYVLSQALDDRGLDYFFILFCIAFGGVAMLVLLGYFLRPSDIEVAQRIRLADPDAVVPVEFVRAFLDPEHDPSTKGKFLPEEAQELDEDEVRNPLLAANWFERMTFGWMGPLMRKGAKQPLGEDDLWKVQRKYRTGVVAKRFSAAWAKEVARPKPSLRHALHVAFGARFYLAGLWLLVQSLTQYIPSLLLRTMLSMIEEEHAKPEAEQDFSMGYVLGFFMLVLLMLMTFAENRYFDDVIRTGLTVRAALVTAIYRKALRMSNKSRQERSQGAITNHMSTDTEKLQLQAMMLHNLWASPLRIVVGMYLLWDGLGASVVAGVLLLMALTPIQVKIMRRVATLMKKQFVEADSRIKAINEILNGARVIKYYCWEYMFRDKAEATRAKELVWLKKIALTRGWMILMINLNPVALAVGTFAAFAVAEGDLTSETAFYALSLFNLLFWPIMMLPRTLAQLLETNISVGRIESFLLCEELDDSRPPALADAGTLSGAGLAAAGAPGAAADNPLSELPGAPIAGVPRGGMRITSGNFSWGDNKILSDVNLNVEPGELVAVIGSTGSGKSSLLSALLGEMDRSSDSEVVVNGSVAYVPQQAWIFNATVRENILFGLPFDEDRYWQAVALSNLEKDFGQFTMEDETELGEHGVNLSGGQRQRVSIARAVYAHTDIACFDDPLSALDAHVAARVFHDCFVDGLKGTTRLLITNQLQFLGHVDRIVVIKDGRLVEVGTYDELFGNHDSEFHRLMQELEKGGGGEEEAQEDGGGGGGDDGAAAGAGIGSGAAGETKASGDGDGDVVDVGDDGAGDAAASAGRRVQAIVARRLAKKQAAATDTDGHLIEKEEREVGGIAWSVYKAYIKSAGGLPFFAFILVMYAFGEVSRIYSSFWLGVWAEDSLATEEDGTPGLGFYMGIFFLLSMGQSIFSAIVSWGGAVGSVRASKRLHETMLMAVLRSPMSFFDSTPLGRIINRFTKDMSQIDTMLMFNVSLFLSGFVKLVGTIITIGIVSPYALVSFVPLMLILWFLQRFFRATSRELKRLDAISRSPVYAHFTESLDGMSSIRAYGAQDRMSAANATKLDANQNIYMISMSTNRWLSIRLEFLGALMVFSSAAFAIFNKQQPALVGLSLSYALSITTQMMMAVRLSTETENSFNAVERVEHYGNMKAEASWEDGDHKPSSPDWPKEGAVSLRNLEMKYRDDGETILKGLTLDIKAGEKIGVVGRTGAGKSTLFQALFRIAEASGGSVLFDGEDISRYGLHTARKAVSIIPQEPTLFSGTVLSNLDPFNEYKDDAPLIEALKKAQLGKAVLGHPLKLRMPVTEGGENFSVGQRQLLCLARALLRKTRILVVDEATANVDMETDALIQQTIRANFSDRTTLTIAHRLNSIIDSDRVLVLDHGKILELDTPQALLSNPASEFSSMVRETGPKNEAYLRRVAMGEVDIAGELETRARRASTVIAARPPVLTEAAKRGEKHIAFEHAIETAMDGVKSRHHAAWETEHRRYGLTKRVWLGHMYNLLDNLHEVTLSAMEEDEFKHADVAEEAVGRLGLGDSAVGHLSAIGASDD